MAASVAFLPLVYANCWIGWIDWTSNWSFQPFRLAPVQSPYARLTCAVTLLAGHLDDAYATGPASQVWTRQADDALRAASTLNKHFAAPSPSGARPTRGMPPP